MNVSRDNELFVATHIPGPSHNYLALRFGDSDEPAVVELNPHCAGSINAARVVPEVLEGLAEANAMFGTAYKLNEIRFCKDDSPRTGIYRSMTLVIVQARHTSG